MKKIKNTKQLPSNFLWGASTSGHQVEGHLVDQWSAWEKKTANNAASSASRRLGKLPSWTYVRKSAEDPKNYISGEGVGHETRYQDDFDILRSLNLNAYRFSIEWSRIEPREGQWDDSAITHYRKYIAELKKRGIEPFPNLWHWTHPLWFEKKGGFTKKKNIKYFERFVRKVNQELFEGITYVVTINEANNFATLGYITAIWPPGKKNPLLGVKVMRNLVRAHKRSYAALKEDRPQLRVGVAHNVTANVPQNPHNVFHVAMSKLSDYFWDVWFYSRIQNYQDYVGANFYMTNYWRFLTFKNPSAPVNDLGWYMEPATVGYVVRRLWTQHKKPIIITENGVADQHDQYRKWWLDQTINALLEARDDGVEIIGYFHWSLLDNFEWAEGYWPRFGLVEVNRQDNMKRTIRPSAKWLAARIKQVTTNFSTNSLE